MKIWLRNMHPTYILQRIYCVNEAHLYSMVMVLAFMQNIPPPPQIYASCSLTNLSSSNGRMKDGYGYWLFKRIVNRKAWGGNLWNEKKAQTKPREKLIKKHVRNDARNHEKTKENEQHMLTFVSFFLPYFLAFFFISA